MNIIRNDDYFSMSNETFWSFKAFAKDKKNIIFKAKKEDLTISTINYKQCTNIKMRNNSK